MAVNGLRRRIATLKISDLVTLASFAMLLAVPGLQLLQSEARATLSAPFVRQTLDPPPAETAGVRAGLIRCRDVTFAATFDPGCQDDRERNRPAIGAGAQCPFRGQPFRSWSDAVVVTADGLKLYAPLPGKARFPDWRVAVVDTATGRVSRWIDLRPAGLSLGTRPTGAAVSPLNAAVFPRSFLVVLNEYGNFATVIDVATDTIIGEFHTGFYAEDLVFNRAGTRLYLTDRLADLVRVFRIDAGPFFTEIARVPAGTIDLDRESPRDLQPLSDVGGATLRQGSGSSRARRGTTASAERRPLVRVD